MSRSWSHGASRHGAKSRSWSHTFLTVTELESLAAPGALVAVLQQHLVELLHLLLLLPDGLPSQLRRHGRGLHCIDRLKVEAFPQRCYSGCIKEDLLIKLEVNLGIQTPPSCTTGSG